MKDEYQCECNIVHIDIVKDTMAKMPQDEVVEGTTKLFKALGDKTRIRIVLALLKHELCVCDIASVLQMTKSAISHQLAVLKEVNVVKGRRSGKEVFYSLDDEHVIDVINEVLVHVCHATCGK